jgi:carboxypeptidase C (cathepsin A)
VADQTSTPPGDAAARDKGAARASEAGGTPTDPAPTHQPADPTDDLVSTRHELKVGRRTLRYTATTGRVVLREEVYEDGTFVGVKPKAEVSLTAYVLDGDDTSRPVTFAFNGGPGSSSVWMHLGLLGPRRVLMGDVGNLRPPPYGIADNPESLLTVSDLVFIDPVSTGYSRAVEGTKPGPFHGYQGDADPSMDAIRGPYAAVFNHYVRDELGYRNDLPYEQLSSRVFPWSFKDFEGRPIDVTPQLERAMRANPHLRVHVAYGYYDGATPHFAAEDVIAHLQIPAALRANIEHRHYEAGHMMYVHEPTRIQQSRDLADFVRRAS